MLYLPKIPIARKQFSPVYPLPNTTASRTQTMPLQSTFDKNHCYLLVISFPSYFFWIHTLSLAVIVELSRDNRLYREYCSKEKQTSINETIKLNQRNSALKIRGSIDNLCQHHKLLHIQIFYPAYSGHHYHYSGVD